MAGYLRTGDEELEACSARSVGIAESTAIMEEKEKG